MNLLLQKKIKINKLLIKFYNNFKKKKIIN